MEGAKDVYKKVVNDEVFQPIVHDNYDSLTSVDLRLKLAKKKKKNNNNKNSKKNVVL